jgi:hypothetical protein
MTDMFCKKCGNLKGDPARGLHKCPPLWRCWAPEWKDQTPEDGHCVYHTSSGWAAEKFVEQEEYHDCDFSVAAGGYTVQVMVMLESVYQAHLDKNPEWVPYPLHPAVDVFEVEGETVAEYHAKEKDKGELTNE